MIESRFRRSAVSYALAVLCSAAATSALAVPDLGNLTSILQGTADGGWAKVNLNAFSDAYPDFADRTSTGYDDPSRVITAWSSFAWDTARGDLLLFGGGHGNYAGNEVYRWRGTTQSWELASLPSQVTAFTTPSGIVTIPVDGAQNAPTSMHTYDNNEYLSVSGRMITLGGPAFNTGGPVIENPDGSLRPTGPYLFDPSRADGSKVGGTTGSGVNPAALGGQMWQNRDNNLSLFNVTTFAGTFSLSPVDGTTAATVENGRDTVYFTGRAGPSQYLMKYTINDVDNPALDTVAMVGATQSAPGAYGAAGFDPDRGFYVGLSENAAQPFVVYDTHAANGAGNYNQVINYAIAGAPAFDGALISGLDWDPTRKVFLIWTGEGDVWSLKAPDSGIMTDQWQLTLVTDGDTFATGLTPDGMDSSGVRGKWKYISNLDAFIALEGNDTGEVWLYRPDGWVTAVPEAGTLAMMLLGLGGLAGLARVRGRHQGV